MKPSVQPAAIHVPAALFRPACALGAVLFALSSLSGQVAPKPSPVERAASEPANAAVAATPTATTAKAAAAGDDVIALSPFEVTSDKDDGFVATSMGTGGRLNLDMKDVAAPFSSMTRDFMDALNITNLVEATQWSTNAAPIYDGQGVDMYGNPNLLNVRGIVQSTNGQRNFSFSASIMDSYNLERYEFGRGPNAGLFNITNGSNDNPLGGGISATSKRARLGRPFTTVSTTFGSWDYYRATVDTNVPVTKNFAVRGNAVWFDRNGWRRGEFEKTKGLTVAGTYLPLPKTQITFEGVADLVERSQAVTLVTDKLSGWDGATTFSTPITDAMYTGMAKQGANQGVDRRSGLYYVFVPGIGKVYNRQNEGLTRRGDENADTPLYSAGRAWYRGTGLPFGNGGNNNAAPTMTANPGDDIWFLGQDNLPGDRFDRAIANSAFRLPDRTFTYLPDHPVFEQHNKDFNAAITHEFTPSLVAELGVDFNRTHDTRMQNTNQWRTTRIDINRNLPDGTANPYFLQPYGDASARISERYTSSRMARFNLGWKHDFGRWGDYHLVLNTYINTTEVKDRGLWMTTAEVPDARVWANSVLQIYYREYWNATARPYNEISDLPATLSRNAYGTGNVLTGTQEAALKPRWSLGSWGETKRTNSVLSLPVKGLYSVFGRRLALTAVPRFDRYDSRVRQSPDFGDLPADWDGTTLSFKPDAPSDWYDLTYVTRNASGNPTVTTPLRAVTRPRTSTAVASVGNTNLNLNLRNPLYANDRFRNDFNPPPNKGNKFTGSYGAVLEVLPWVDIGANWASTYSVPPTDTFTINNELVTARVGWGTDGFIRLRTRDDRFFIKLNAYYNVADHARITSSVVQQANTLLAQQPAANSVTGDRNVRGIQDFATNDYASQWNKGFEVEVTGKPIRGLRVTLNGGSSKQGSFDQYELTAAWLGEWEPALRDVLTDAGGMLTGGTQASGAPGLAVANPAVTPLNGTARTNAVNAYNNMWAQYSGVVAPARLGRQNIVTYLRGNVYADYTVQGGLFKALRLGLGVQWRGGRRGNVAGTRVGQSIVNAAGVVVDDPTVDNYNNVYIEQPLNTVATIGYHTKLFRRDVDFQLNIRNLLNEQAIVYQDSGITLRAPGGDLSVPYRVATASRIADYQQPISFLFTTKVSF
ncbi:hypothetical protein [Opitutus sp. ER46]|uniref:hypothetical protein n=1 Tax=Opitutus sp. ER46 TaxID=2161864 RepID=UPI000D4576A5|nr:hypothetical protein [Opitutus sp. ER46]PTX92344.1 hypothetical protein DB354_13470 [Opitutus sp. ER46]